jgi:hypothetical protein
VSSSIFTYLLFYFAFIRCYTGALKISKLLDEIYFHLINLPSQQRESGITFESLQQSFPTEIGFYGRGKIEAACRQDFDHRFIILQSSMFSFNRKYLKIPLNEEFTSEIIYCSLKKLELTNIKRQAFNKQPLLLSFGQAYSLTRLFPFLSVSLNVFNRIIQKDKRFSFGGQYFMLKSGYCSSLSPDYFVCDPEKELRQQQYKQHQLQQQQQLMSSWAPYERSVVVPTSCFASSVSDFPATTSLLGPLPSWNASMDTTDNMQQHEQNVENLLLTETSLHLEDDEMSQGDQEETSSVVEKSDVGSEIAKKEAKKKRGCYHVTIEKIFWDTISPTETETSGSSSNIISFSPAFSHRSSNFMIFNASDDDNTTCLSHLISSMQSSEVSLESVSSHNKTIIFLKNPKELDSLMKNRKLTSSHNVSLFVTANRVAEYQVKYHQLEVSENELCEDWQDLSPSWCPSFLSTSSCSTNNILVNSVHPIQFCWSAFIAALSSLLTLFSFNNKDDSTYTGLSYLSAYARKEKEFPTSFAEFLQDFRAAFPNQHHRLIYLMQCFIMEESSGHNRNVLSLLEQTMFGLSLSSVHEKKLIVILLEDPFLSDVDLNGVYHHLLCRLISTVSASARGMTLVFNDFDCRHSQLLIAFKEIVMGRCYQVIFSQSFLSFNSSLFLDFPWAGLFDVVFINGKLSKSALTHISGLLSFVPTGRELHDLCRLNTEVVRGCVMYPISTQACGLFHVVGTNLITVSILSRAL